MEEEGYEDFKPTIPEDEKQVTYEETFNVMSPLTGVSDLQPIKRVDIELYEKEKAFLLYNVLSPSECEYYIKTAESLGLDSTPIANNPKYRNNARVVAKSQEVSSLIFSRIKPYLLPIEITTEDRKNVGVGYRLEGIWNPQILNEVWRLCRYSPGGHFAPHFDGTFVRSTNVRSMKTFMLYLNGGFEGGTTNFISDVQKLFKDPNTGMYRAEEKNILLRIVPEPGMAIIFNHQLLHEGAQLTSGKKYIMRSDILFERAVPIKDLDPKEEEAILLIQKAETLESDGKAEESAACYRRAFRLWPPLEYVT